MERTTHGDLERRWAAIEQTVSRITDGLGMPIDPGIKETVVALMAHGFLTRQSCEGHPDSGHGEPFPWVSVTVPFPAEWEPYRTWTPRQRKERSEFLRPAVEFEIARLRVYLEEFYSFRLTSDQVRLTVTYMKPGSCRLHSAIAPSTSEEHDARRTDKAKWIADHREVLALASEEMRAFTAFLRDKYFNR
jgi:hypothetical protein